VNAFRISLVLFFAAALVACSSISTTYDFDPDADFSKYTSYAWMKKDNSTNSLLDKRIEKAADYYLGRAGLKKVPDSPDLLVVSHFGTQEKTDVSSYGYGYGWGWRGGGGVDVYQYTEGTLVLDIVDAKTKQLVWRGTAESELDNNTSPNKIDAKLDTVMDALFQNYPPKKR